MQRMKDKYELANLKGKWEPKVSILEQCMAF